MVHSLSSIGTYATSSVFPHQQAVHVWEPLQWDMVWCYLKKTTAHKPSEFFYLYGIRNDTNCQSELKPVFIYTGFGALTAMAGLLFPIWEPLQWTWCGAILRRPQLISPQNSSICMIYEKTQTVGVSWNQYLFVQEFTCLLLVVLFSICFSTMKTSHFYTLQSCTIWFTSHPSNKDTDQSNKQHSSKQSH